jgi:hypothetical protein
VRQARRTAKVPVGDAVVLQRFLLVWRIWLSCLRGSKWEVDIRSDLLLSSPVPAN